MMGKTPKKWQVSIMSSISLLHKLISRISLSAWESVVYRTPLPPDQVVGIFEMSSDHQDLDQALKAQVKCHFL